MTAVELWRAIQEKRIGVEELTSAYLKRIEKYDGINGLNTVAELEESALKQARKMDSLKTGRDSAMFGLPVLVKDNIDVAGLHTTAGSLALADNIAVHDAAVIENLKHNGAIILGKTNMTEFANYTAQGMPGGYSSRGGQVKNAYDCKKDPSGSSSGSAVAMSAGFCAAAIGTDTSFSVVGCATVNGVVGLKPAHGSLSSQGIIPIAHTLDSAGALTRSVSDAILVYSSMRAAPLPHIAPTDPRSLHIAVNTFHEDQVSEAQTAKYEDLFGVLRMAGAKFSYVSHGHTPYQREIMKFEFKHDLEEYLLSSSAHAKTLQKIIELYEAKPKQMMKYGISFLHDALHGATGKLNDPEYLEAMKIRERMRRQLIADLGGYDACVMTGPTNIMHFTGLPSIALKLGMGNDQTPRGIILYGADEYKLFAAALAIEKYCRPVVEPALTA